MNLTKFAQSTVSAENNGVTILIDPGNYNFEPGRVSRDFFTKVDVLLITHKHADHFDLEAVKAIHKSCKPVIYTVAEIVDSLSQEGIPSQRLAIGQRIEHGEFQIEAVPADHTVKGETIDIFGVVLECAGRRVYHASDTFYLQEKPMNMDLVFVPINNRGVAMGFDDAKTFVTDIQPRIAVPVHYDSPKDAHIKPEDWATLFQGTNIDVRIMGFGDTITI